MVEDPSMARLGFTEVCLLAGGIRRPAIETDRREKLWALPIIPDRTVLDLWLDRLYDLSDARPRIRMLVSEPLGEREAAFVRCRGIEIVPDVNEFRGPGGALRDATTHLSPEDSILVAEMSRVVLCDLHGLLSHHNERQNTVTVAANHDGSPSGVYAMTGEALSRIAPRGYVDLKEQWLPSLREAREKIGVCRLPGFGALPLRSEREFRDAMRVITDPAVVITRDPRSNRNGSPLDRQTSNEAVEAHRIVVRSSIFPDGSIKASKNVVDGSSTGSHPLSDDRVRSDSRRRRGA